MNISSKIYQLREEYVRKHETEPELLFVNFQTWEEMLNSTQSINGVPKEIGGCELIPANEMQEDLFYCNLDDLNKALEYFDGSNQSVSIRKLTVSDRKEAANASRLGPELTYQYFQIPGEAIKAFQRHEEHKKLKF